MGHKGVKRYRSRRRSSEASMHGSARIFLIGTFILLVATPAFGRKYELAIRSPDLVLADPSSNTYIFRVRLPEKLRNLRIDLATLEFFVEASSENESNSTFALTFAPLASFSEEDSTYVVEPGNWPVFVGASGLEGKRALVDITSVARAWQGHRGAIYGALFMSTGGEGVRCEISTSSLGPDVIAKIRLFAME